MTCLKFKKGLYFFLFLSLSLTLYSLLQSSMADETDGGGLHAAICQRQSGDDNDLDLVSK